MATGCQKYICNSSRSACTLTKEAFHMLKKNTRKRLLAGALATVMMLTMCPSWALADDEDIALLPANEEIAVPVVDSTPAADPTETPAVPTPSEPEAKPAEDQNTAPAPSDDGANGGTDSTESGNSNNPTIPEVSENNSQNNNAASNSPENEISMASLDVDAYSLNGVKTIEAEYWITNLHAKDDNGSWKLSIDKDTVGEDGKSVAELAPSERHVTADETYNTVFWQARVQHGLLQHQTTLSNDDKTQSGTEITSIRYKNDRLEYCAKDSSEWTAFAWNDHLVFYYLIRTEYSQMVQIDVSDWTVDKEQTQHLNRRSVTYQVIVEENGTQTVADSKKFWYNKAFTVSSVRVRQTESENYSINRVELDPSTMGTVGEVDGEYRFSLDLTKAKRDEATVKIYVEPKVQSHQLTYKLNGGKITSAEGTYTPAGSVYPDATVNTPEVAKDNCDFGGWYIDEALTQKWTGTTMPDANLTLYAKWVPNDFEVSYYVDKTLYGDIEDHAVDSTVTVRTAHPEKEGYTFTGWTPAADVANIIKVDDNGHFTMPAQDVRFDATFEINQYNVTYKVGTEVVGTDVYNFNSDVAIRPVPTQEGYTFYGWTSKDSAFDIRGFKMPAHNVVIEGKFEKNPAKQYTYTVNKHFYNEKGVEVNVVKGEATPAAENTAVSDLYKADAKNQTVDGKTYVYVSGLTTVTDNLEKLTKDVTIDLYYYLNVEGGNDIPDAWEYRLTFKVVNGSWNDGTSADIVTYVQFKDQKTGEAFKDEAVVVPVTRIPAVGDKPNSGYHAGAWDTSPYDNYKVQKDTVFTYTYAKNSSGGSSGGHHRRPTVTIPDDVPTGLNGDDHYAYIVGYPDKTVRPQNGITRAEVATIFFRLLTDETRNANSTKSNSYSDVAAGAWYNHAVSTLSAMGIVKGDSHGKFNPNAPITRAEFAAIAARFDDKANTTTADFSDIASHWAKNEISAASNNGWITGYPDGTFRPDNKITRAEAMTLVNRVLKRLPETEEDLHDDMIKWSDNSDVSQWFYLDVQEATNSHYYQTKENQFEKWTKLRETRDWTELEK